MDDNGCLPMFLLVFGVAFGFFLGWVVFRKDQPTALDVYQGKTILEVTYQGDVPVDSAVVFK